jgi:hypothetical protein
MEVNMVIQNSLSVLKDLSSIEDKIKVIEDRIKKDSLEIDMEDILLTVLNSQIN